MLSPKQQRRPLPSRLSLSFFYDGIFRPACTMYEYVMPYLVFPLYRLILCTVLYYKLAAETFRLLLDKCKGGHSVGIMLRIVSTICIALCDEKFCQIERNG